MYVSFRQLNKVNDLTCKFKTSVKQKWSYLITYI